MVQDVGQRISQLHDEFSRLYQQGDYRKAHEVAEQACRLARQHLDPHDLDLGLCLNDLAMGQQLMGNYTDAQKSYEEALNIARQAGSENSIHVAAVLANLALLHLEMGQYNDASQKVEQAQKALDSAIADNEDRASALSTLAGVCDALNHYDAAEKYHQQALDLKRTLNKPHLVAESLNNLAVVKKKKRDWASAERLYEQALRIWQDIAPGGHTESAQTRCNLAALLAAEGNYTGAEELYKQALQFWRATLGQDHPKCATGLWGLALLCAATQREAEALALMQQAMTIRDRETGQVFATSSERRRLERIESLSMELNAVVSLIAQGLANVPASQQAGLDLILRRKAIGAEALAVQRDTILGGRYPGLQSALNELNDVRARIAHKMLTGSSAASLAEHQRRQEQLETELARQIPEMNLERNLRAADRKAVAQALPENTLLIEFVRCRWYNFGAVPVRGEKYWKPAHYVAFTLPAGAPDNVQMIDLGEAMPIDQMIGAFRAWVTSEAPAGHETHDISQGRTDEANDARQVRESCDVPEGQVAGGGDGGRLRAAIFDPLLPAIGECRSLILAPDGDLSRLPFEVLPQDNVHRLIDDYEISYVSVGRDVLRFGSKSAHEPAAPLVMADPDFDLGAAQARPPASGTLGRVSRDLKPGALRFNRLPGTRIEGENVSGMLGVKPLLEGNALEGALKACPSPSILHIATHGFFLPDQKHNQDDVFASLGAGSGPGFAQGMENPLLRTGLALAGANNGLSNTLPAEAEDGLLNAVDVMGMDLLDTQLAVLSACGTGLGAIQVGEGVLGLRRAFVVAGAKTLVMSLWKVPDQQTQELMQDFYRRLLEKGQGRAAALREAQLAMEAKYPDPFYWGAFICQGDPSPIPQFLRSKVTP